MDRKVAEKLIMDKKEQEKQALDSIMESINNIRGKFKNVVTSKGKAEVFCWIADLKKDVLNAPKNMKSVDKLFV